MSNLLRKLLSHHVSTFAVVGAIGFIVDAAVLKFYLISIENDPIWGRAVSFPAAVTITWLLNRHFTFSQKGKIRSPLLKEWSSYLLINAFGLGVNLSIFMLIIYTVSDAKLYPIITLGFASLTAMFFNYLGSKYWVFNIN